MRLTALWLCGTLLALTSLPWTTTNSGVGDILGDEGFGPCAATLRLEEPCRQGQARNTCPYLFRLPPLTVHLPKQLRELEEIVKDLQTLKDNVDELRKMCSDCTVSQSGRECGRHYEKERENLNEGRDGDENEWMDGGDRGNPRGCGTDRVNVDKTMEGDGDADAENRPTLDEQERKQWDTEQRGERGVIKENEKDKTLRGVAGKDGKNQTERAKGGGKPGQAEAPTAGENGKTVDMAGEKGSENNNRDQDSNKQQDGNRGLKGEPGDKREKNMAISIKNTDKRPARNHDVRQDETTTTRKETHSLEDRSRDGIKMSEDHDRHTNKDPKQHSEEKKEGIKTGRNNETPTENTGRETIKEVKAEGADRETGKETKTEEEKTVQGEQRDSDGGSASSKATQGTDLVSISPTARPSIGLDASYDSLDSSEATTFTSSIPSPDVPSSPLYSITDANQRRLITTSGLPTPSTGAAGVSEILHEGTTDTGREVSVLHQQATHAAVRSISATSVGPGAGFQSQVTTTTTRSYSLYTTTEPGVTVSSPYDRSSNSKFKVKPPPDRGTKTDKKPKPGIKPKVNQGQKNLENYPRPEGAPLPKPEQKQKNQKPTTAQKPKPGKDTKYVQISRPDQKTLINKSHNDQNLTNNAKPTPDQARTPDDNKLPNQKPNSHQKSIPQTTPVTTPVNVEAISSDRQPEGDQTSFTNQNSKPDKKPQTQQTPGRKMTNKENLQPDQRSEANQNITHLQESETDRRETTQHPPKPKLNQDENPPSKPKSQQHSTPGPKLIPARNLTPPDPRPKTGHEIHKLNQKPKPGHTPKFNLKHPGPMTDRQPDIKPKPGKTTQTSQGIKAPPSDQRPDPKPKTVPGKIPEVESSKTVKPRLPPRQRPPTTPVRQPGATLVQRPKPAAQPKPSEKTKSDLDLLQVSVTASNTNQESQTDLPPTSGSGRQTDDVPHPSVEHKLSHSMMETVGPKTSTSLDTDVYTAPESFTMSPNSRISSDIRPTAPGQPVTARPNDVVSDTSPGSTKQIQPDKTDSSLQPTRLHSVDETASEQTPEPHKPRSPLPSQSPQTTSTPSSASRSTTSANSAARFRDVDASTPSARELRVKINQVAARINSSLNERQLDRGPEKPLEDDQRGRYSNPPTLTSPRVPTPRRDCSDHLIQGGSSSGVYLVTPDPRSHSFPVFCDMVLGGGGWTLIQRRQDGSVSFNRTWAEYRSGFGELDGGEFWLGNQQIHLLTRGRDMALRVELQDFNGVTRFAQYEQFRVASERLRFRLTVGGYSGDAGDALRFSRTYDHNHRAFTTPDQDHDRYPSGNCGAYYSSGWWFDACMAANLNGRYYVKRYKGIRNGIFWGTWHNITTEYYPTNYRQSFRSVRMMIRPKGFAPEL